MLQKYFYIIFMYKICLYSEEIRKEIRDLKRSVQNEKKAKEADKKQQAAKEEDKKSGLMKEFIETQEKYKAKNPSLPKKGKTREDFMMDQLNKFKSKLQTAKSETTKHESASNKKTSEKDTEEDDDPQDDSWMAHALHCEEKEPVLAKDASTKDDDWFEIYDPRNPLNKRRRGEKSKDDKRNRHKSSRHEWSV